jgi:hypothetical protein
VALAKKGENWAAMGFRPVSQHQLEQEHLDQGAGCGQRQGLGFGKAAPGASYRAMYLDGKIDEVVGIYRSIDTGATGVRIDSPRAIMAMPAMKRPRCGSSQEYY